LRSGFATLVGRPNVGKSTLLNRILGTKVSIVSDKPQTTRTQVRGVLNRRNPDVQIVFVDTPGIHKPRTLLGERLNETAAESAEGVDVVCFVVDATQPIGRGDEFVAARVPPDSLLVLNKVDAASRDDVLAQLTAASRWDFAEYFPVSAKTVKAWTRWSTPSSDACLKARSSIPTTWSPTCPRRSGWPSWCGSSCWR
jgi:GTPase